MPLVLKEDLMVVLVLHRCLLEEVAGAAAAGGIARVQQEKLESKVSNLNKKIQLGV